MHEPTLFSPKDLEQIFKISAGSIREWGHTGLLCPVYVSPRNTERKRMYFRGIDVLDFLLKTPKPLPPASFRQVVSQMRVGEIHPNLLLLYAKENAHDLAPNTDQEPSPRTGDDEA